MTSGKPPAPRPDEELDSDEPVSTDADLDETDAEPDEAELPEVDASDLKFPLAKRSDTLGSHDPLAAYMRDVQRYKLLTREEEHALAVKFTESGDPDAARALVLSNLRLVVKIAYDYRQAHRNLLDLVQEGNLGLMQAVQKFDPYKGVKLSSYAAWWIRAYMLRYILSNFRLVKLGTTQAQRKLFFNLQKEKAKLDALGIAPDAKTIAARLGVPVREVESMEGRLGYGESSLDAPIHGSDGRSTTGAELLDAGDEDMEGALGNIQIDAQMQERIHEYASTLQGKDKRIFESRLLAEEPLTLQDLGSEFGVSRERVRQLEKRLLLKMRQYLETSLGKDVIDVYEAP